MSRSHCISWSNTCLLVRVWTKPFLLFLSLSENQRFFRNFEYWMTLSHQNNFLILTSVLCDGRRIKSDGDGGTHFIYPTKNNKIWATVYHQTTPWNKKIWKITFSFKAIHHKKPFSLILPQIGTVSPVAQFPSQGTVSLLGSLDSVPQSECCNKALRIPVSPRKRRESGARRLVSFVTVFKALYASTPNSLYSPSYHSINHYCLCFVLEVWTNSEGWSRKGEGGILQGVIWLQLWPCDYMFLI